MLVTNKYVVCCDNMNEEIKNWIYKMKNRSGYMPPVFKEWPENLWSKSTEDIMNYIYERFLETTSRTEYYYTMFYLNKLVEADKLYVFFEYRSKDTRKTVMPEGSIVPSNLRVMR